MFKKTALFLMDGFPYCMMCLTAGLNKLWNPSTPDWRLWRKFGKHWEHGEQREYRKDGKRHPDELKHSIYDSKVFERDINNANRLRCKRINRRD